MPKVNYISKPKAPPIDEAWGMMLARKAQLGWSLKDIADRTGINYGRLRRFWNNPPIEWCYDDLVRVLNEMGLEARMVITEKGAAR